ncbi:Wiskott-Aldrich syndrome protein family member 3 [Bagarius yarrelli]|uniref:Wiskott-Aldrich syndrome protein family member 3 n=1 Tax=Bagarius yarrelli TaxID=175774 RepID=A0A556TT11_BAGYA|nr:Wiskott-Aldrich syndrome protein family member 3 [Bagarius yarrelli]
MPFNERTVEPRLLCRLKVKDAVHGEMLFSSLDEVSSRALTLLLRQLSDVSRHASDIFRGVELQAARVFQRSARIQQRLNNLQTTVYQLNPKKVQIRCYSSEVGFELVV